MLVESDTRLSTYQPAVGELALGRIDFSKSRFRPLKNPKPKDKYLKVLVCRAKPANVALSNELFAKNGVCQNDWDRRELHVLCKSWQFLFGVRFAIDCGLLRKRPSILKQLF